MADSGHSSWFSARYPGIRSSTATTAGGAIADPFGMLKSPSNEGQSDAFGNNISLRLSPFGRNSRSGRIIREQETRAGWREISKRRKMPRRNGKSSGTCSTRTGKRNVTESRAYFLLGRAGPRDSMPPSVNNANVLTSSEAYQRVASIFISGTRRARRIIAFGLAGAYNPQTHNMHERNDAFCACNACNSLAFPSAEKVSPCRDRQYLHTCDISAVCRDTSRTLD